MYKNIGITNGIFRCDLIYAHGSVVVAVDDEGDVVVVFMLLLFFVKCFGVSGGGHFTRIINEVKLVYYLQICFVLYLYSKLFS